MLDELEHQVHIFGLLVNDNLLKAHNIFMIKLLKKTDLTDSCHWETITLFLIFYLLKSPNIIFIFLISCGGDFLFFFILIILRFNIFCLYSALINSAISPVTDNLEIFKVLKFHFWKLGLFFVFTFLISLFIVQKLGFPLTLVKWAYFFFLCKNWAHKRHLRIIYGTIIKIELHSLFLVFYVVWKIHQLKLFFLINW